MKSGQKSANPKAPFVGTTTADKSFNDQKVLKRHQGLPNAGARSADSGARTDNEKSKN
ncbi:hypothetical protein [Olivibacter sp. XZL3]|uniref:hypothetical protein n=1 Tax=Olivibacter sp. XZL3 TaxID=1735116 RepID=UPI001416FA4C|nr:hypothetical protein [Olivibacter sp. XZL3]